MLHIVHQVEECADTLAFATEPVYASLANILAYQVNFIFIFILNFVYRVWAYKSSSLMNILFPMEIYVQNMNKLDISVFCIIYTIKALFYLNKLGGFLTQGLLEYM